MTHPWQSLCIFSGVKTIVTSYLKLKEVSYVGDSYISFQEPGLLNSTELTVLNDDNEKMIRRLTLFFVPISFAIILITGLIGNILVIVVVSILRK